MKNIYISQNADRKLIDYLTSYDRTIHFVPNGNRTYPAVDAHADIYYCQTGVAQHARIIKAGLCEIGEKYPDNIPFNAVFLDRYCIHNLKHTSPSLLKEAKALGLEPVHVKQGYTKCNCVVVDGHSLITADGGIIGNLKKYPDIDVLPICQGFVRLDGFEYGFLGGASGRVGDEIIFNGNLSAHPDYEAIMQFIASRGLKVKFFPDYPLTDIGSILADF
ncbi:MAG: hypothetical protein IJM51_10565 [Clostridia bacterium]|nr:hypothetical protein [Clostridia bacterium]